MILYTRAAPRWLNCYALNTAAGGWKVGKIVLVSFWVA